MINLIRGQEYCIKVPNGKKHQYIRGIYRGQSKPPPGLQRSFWHEFARADGSRVSITRKNVISFWSEYEQTDEFRQQIYDGALQAWRKQMVEELRAVATFAAASLHSPPDKVTHRPRIDVSFNDPRPETTEFKITLDTALDCMRALGYPIPDLDLPQHPSEILQLLPETQAPHE